MKFAYLVEPPFNHVGADGSVTGTDVELARTVLAALGTSEVELVETEFAELLPGVAEGRWRMTTGLFATEERRRIASFSRPIWALPDGLLVPAGNPLELAGYRSVAARGDCTLAVIRDQFQHRSAIELGIPEHRLSVFDTYTAASAAVLGGEVDAYASVARAHTGYIDLHGESRLEVIVVPATEKPPAFGSFAFAKDDDLRRDVDEVLAPYLGSEGHRSMMRGFGFSDDEVDLILDGG